jgi:hypothetical protein
LQELNAKAAPANRSHFTIERIINIFLLLLFRKSQQSWLENREDAKDAKKNSDGERGRGGEDAK